MNLDRINIINHEFNNFRNKITRLEEELASIENNDVCEYDQFCELVHMNDEPTIYDIENLYNTMKKLKKSGIEGLKIQFEDMVEEDFDGYETEYINARVAQTPDSFIAHQWGKVNNKFFEILGINKKDIIKAKAGGMDTKSLLVSKLEALSKTVSSPLSVELSF